MVTRLGGLCLGEAEPAAGRPAGGRWLIFTPRICSVSSRKACPARSHWTRMPTSWAFAEVPGVEGGQGTPHAPSSQGSLARRPQARFLRGAAGACRGRGVARLRKSCGALRGFSSTIWGENGKTLRQGMRPMQPGVGIVGGPGCKKSSALPPLPEEGGAEPPGHWHPGPWILLA